MQACIHTEGLCAGLGHSCGCWQGNVLVYNSQGPGSREHIAGGHPPCQLGTLPVQWSHTLPIPGEPGPHGPSLIQTLDLLELNLPPSKPSSRQDRLVVELEKKVYEDLTITEKAPARDWDADDAKVIRAG